MSHSSIATAGIDTAKDKLDVAVHGQPGTRRIDNSPDGWARLAHDLAQAGVRRIGIEATGGYERGIMRHLQAEGFTVALLQPLQVKAFARLHLRRAKNDRIDAQLIAACTVAIDAKDSLPPDPQRDALVDHLTFIEQVEEDAARLKTRLEHISEPRLRRMVEDDIRDLDARRSREIKKLLAALRAHAELSRRYLLVLTIDGIGSRTAISIVLRMPELGQLSREQAAALAGLAPFVQTSGKHIGETHIAGGRARLRRALYAAALPAAFRWNKALGALYHRLIARGHAHTSALVACARKLIVFANAVLQRGTPWRKAHAT